MNYVICFWGVIEREFLRFVQQRSRLLSGLVRPLLWLFVFAAGFRNSLGLSIIEPYSNYILYEEYIVPGLACMIVLFNSMQTSLSMVYDREMGSMKVLLMSPFNKTFLLASKLFANALIACFQVYIFFAIVLLIDVQVSLQGYLMALPILFLSAYFLGALGLLIANYIKQLENFAGVMNFVIFPMFFLSSALYPLWKMQESSEWLFIICSYNPFTFAVESLRYAMYEQIDAQYLGQLIICFVVTSIFALRSFQARKSAGKAS